MEKKKEGKRSFWASLFAPKPCSCGGNIIEEVSEEETGKAAPQKSNESGQDSKPSSGCACGCGQ